MDYIKLEAYVNLLLYRLNIKDGDSLFVSIPKCERTLKDYIEYVANTKGITDIYFYINDLNTIYIYLVLTNKYLHKCKPKHNVVWT